jgi:hypothetical protein
MAGRTALWTEHGVICGLFVGSGEVKVSLGTPTNAPTCTPPGSPTSLGSEAPPLSQAPGEVRRGPAQTHSALRPRPPSARGCEAPPLSAFVVMRPCPVTLS